MVCFHICQVPIGNDGWSENDALNPLSAYGRQKLMCERFLEDWYNNWRHSASAPERVAILRPFSVFGPWGRPDMAPHLFLDGIYRNSRINLVEGSVLRDFTYIEDLVRAISMAAGIVPQRSPAPPQGLSKFNIGSGAQRSMLDLANEIAEALGRPPGSFHARPVSLGAEEAPVTLANISLAHQQLGWEPLVPWQDGIRRTVEWYVQHVAPRPLVVAVVATCGRPRLLRERALASIARQVRAPNAVVVVDDSAAASCRSENRAAVAAARGGGNWRYTLNARTAGASGAWNTGILEAMELARAARRRLDEAFVAILDDDDEWAPDHLQACEALAAKTGAQQVVSGLMRVEEGGAAPRRLRVPSPEEMDPATFHATNPGIQGSNLFVTVAALLSAGLFAEHLLATTDRDLMVRLSAMGSKAHPVAMCVGLHTALHHAGGGLRLTTDVPRKRRSLEEFLRDHGPHMAKVDLDRFLSRSAKLFGADLRVNLTAKVPLTGTGWGLGGCKCAAMLLRRSCRILVCNNFRANHLQVITSMPVVVFPFSCLYLHNSYN